MDEKLVELMKNSSTDSPTMYVLCGIPGSGKTTLGKTLSEQYGIVLHTYDDLPNANRKAYIESVRELFHNGIVNDLSNGRSVICDRAYTTVEGRKRLLDAAAKVQCRKVIIVFSTPFTECIARNMSRERRLPNFIVSELHRKYEEPTLKEGWDEIVHI